jgi:hypothetical protein
MTEGNGLKATHEAFLQAQPLHLDPVRASVHQLKIRAVAVGVEDAGRLPAVHG